jgi:hypothetical protein
MMPSMPQTYVCLKNDFTSQKKEQSLGNSPRLRAFENPDTSGGK